MSLIKSLLSAGLVQKIGLGTKGLIKEYFPTADLQARYSASSIKLVEGTYYLEDLKGDKDIELTNADQISSGVIPYKSNITLTPPTGLTDVTNGFWYDAGTPYELYPQSFFNDIDYEHKIFVKTQDQVLGGNNVEITPSGIKEILVYSQAKTGDELSKINNYINYETESFDLNLDGVTGNNGNNGSTRALAFLTFNYLRNNTNADDLIAIYSALYNESDVYNPITRAINKGLGRVLLTMQNAETFGIQLNQHYIQFSGVILDDNGVVIGFGSFIADNTLIDRCVIKNCTSHLFRQDGEGNILKRSLLDSSTIAAILKDSNTIREVGVSGSFTDNSLIHMESTTTDDILNILYCLFNQSTENNLLEFANGTLNFKFNKITSTSITTILLNVNQAVSGTLNIEYNEFYCNFAGSIFSKTQSSPNYNINFKNNTIVATNVVGQGVSFDNQNDIDFSYNNVRISNNLSSGNKYIYPVNSLNSFQSNYNNIHVKVAQGYGLQVGDSTQDISYSVQCLGNKLLGNWYFDSELAQSNVPHALIFAWRHIGTIESKYNYLDGGLHAIVYKGLGTTPTEALITYNIAKNQLLAKGQKNVKFYNNTCIITQSGTGAIRVMQNNSASEPSTGCLIKNNIIINTLQTQEYAVNLDDAASETGLGCDYNIYYSQNNDVVFNYKGTDKTFAEWQALGFDANSIVLTEEQFNNLFTDFDNNDFSLKTGSVAIGTGADLGVTYDDGLDSSTDWGDSETVPSVVTKQQTGSWDIGAYVS